METPKTNRTMTLIYEYPTLSGRSSQFTLLLDKGTAVNLIHIVVIITYKAVVDGVHFNNPEQIE